MLVEKGGCQRKGFLGSGHMAGCWSPALREPAPRTACPGVLCELWTSQIIVCGHFKSGDLWIPVVPSLNMELSFPLLCLDIVHPTWICQSRPCCWFILCKWSWSKPVNSSNSKEAKPGTAWVALEHTCSEAGLKAHPNWCRYLWALCCNSGYILLFSME